MTSDAPVIPPPSPEGLSASLERNIAVLQTWRQKEAASSTREEKIAAAITSFTGSMRFVYLHLVLYGAWILINLGVIPVVPRFDPSFVILAMVASVEAIFLSTFVLISQNRTAAEQDKRADLDLQISLLAEHELTKLAEMVVAIRDHLGIQTNVDREMDDATKDVAPEKVLDVLGAQRET